MTIVSLWLSCSFDSEEVPVMCQRNAAAASAAGRKDLVQVEKYYI